MGLWSKAVDMAISIVPGELINSVTDKQTDRQTRFLLYIYRF